MDLTQYIEAGTRGGAARPRWAVNVGWEGCHGPSPRCRGGSLRLAMRGGGFSGSKSRYAAQLSINSGYVTPGHAVEPHDLVGR